MDEKIRAAYEQMSPTDEQVERLWKNLESQMQEEPQAQATQSAGQNAAQAGTSNASATPSARRSGFSAWKVAAPLAACLVVGAIAIGVGGLGAEQSNTKADADGSSSGTLATDSGLSSTMEADGAMAADQLNAAGGAYLAEEVEIDTMPIEPSDPFNTEEYAAIDENGFVLTSANPLSTVSADVDTASYANLRRMINDGYNLSDVPSGAVRIEEMLNYFTYDYATPTGDDLFSMQAQASTCPWNPDTQLLTLGFATQYETSAAEKGANLVFLIDVSGSMDSPDKLELLQDSFATLLDSLDGNDRVSIVTYSGQEELVLEGAAGDDDAQILKAIYRLNASGSTNGEAGLEMAYDVAERNFIDGGVNRIIMASDGDLNVGMTSTSDLYDFVESKRDTGIYLSVLGFGSGNYKDTKMETLADHGNGSYHYIDSVEEADRVLNDRLMANLVPFADDVKVQVEFNPAQVKAYRLIGYENRELPDEAFLDDTVDAGDVGPNAQFTVAYEIVPADSAYELPDLPELKYSANYAGSSSNDWLTCSLRYRAFADNTVHQQELEVSAADSTAKPNDDWKFASAVIAFGMIAEDSDYLGTASLQDVLKTLDGMQLSPEREGFRDLVAKASLE